MRQLPVLNVQLTFLSHFFLMMLFFCILEKAIKSYE